MGAGIGVGRIIGLNSISVRKVFPSEAAGGEALISIIISGDEILSHSRYMGSD